MKPQDILFIAVLIILLFLRKPKLIIAAGLVCLIFSIPLFHFWIFFTAERLIVYAWTFLIIAVLWMLINSQNR